MPHRRCPDGRFVRLAYRAEDYTLPERELARLLEVRAWGTARELGTHDGMYANYDRIRELERDGARWVLLAERSRGWLLEVECTDDPAAQILPLPPEAAWAHARATDLASTPPIELDGPTVE